MYHYHLVNKMTEVQNLTLGTVLSVHKSWENAEKAHSKLQNQIRKASGNNSYLPTKIVRSEKRYGKGICMPVDYP
jgi:hypothetical protein